MLGSLPLAGLGLIAFLSARGTTRGHAGIAGALAGLDMVVAVAMIVVAAVVFVVGPICYIRAADE
jgi:hypothetical protein